jgi:hypothetical protein
LVSGEKAVIEYLLSRSIPNLDQFKDQVPHTTVTGPSCKCGCPSVALQVDRIAPAAPLGATIDGVGKDEEGNLVGVILWAGKDGYLNDLEAYGFDVHPPHGLPTVESLTEADQQEDEWQRSRTRTDEARYLSRRLQLALHRVKWWLQGDR